MKKYLLMLTIALIMTGCTKVSETVMEPESIPEREQVSEMENVWEAENLQETEVLSEAEVLLAEETVQEEVFRLLAILNLINNLGNLFRHIGGKVWKSSCN